MSEIVLFNFESHDIRYVGDGIKHEWVATDICEALNVKNTSQALDRLDDDEKGMRLIYTLGGEQELLTVNEPGLYGLVLGSRKPEAKRFKRWLKHEVLPAIREKGVYSLKQSQSSSGLSFDEIKEATKFMAEIHGIQYARDYSRKLIAENCPEFLGPEPQSTSQVIQFPVQSSKAKHQKIDASVISFVESGLKLLPVHPEVSEPEVTSAQMVEWYQDYCQAQCIRPIGSPRFICQLKALTPRHFRPRRRYKAHETNERTKRNKPPHRPAHWVCIEFAS